MEGKQRLRSVLACVIVILLAVRVASAAEEHGHGDLDAFDEILKSLNATSEFLSADNTEKFLDKVFHQITCQKNSSSSTCTENICFDIPGLFRLIGANTSVGVSEEQFGILSSVTLHYVLDLQAHCGQTVDPSTGNVTYIEQHLLSKLDHDNTGLIVEEGIDHVLEDISPRLSHIDHAHEGHDDHEHETEVEVLKDKCLSADAVLYQLRSEEGVATSKLGDVSGFIIYYLYIGSDINESCRTLPKQKYFIDEVFKLFHSVNNTLPKSEFQELLEKLNITQKKTDDGHGHAHKRSISLSSTRSREAEFYPAASRVKRQADGHQHGTAKWEKTCYSADQFLAIFRAPASGSVSQQIFTDLCPALVHQQVTAACVSQTQSQTSNTTTPTMAERYGFGTLANFIICLCSVLGALMYPCSHRIGYNALLATFVGLAVGTLLSDALLHLLPEALALHAHGPDDGHNHGDEIIVEDFVTFTLATLAGIYGFYLVEALYSSFCSYGHGHTHDISHNYEASEHSSKNGYPVAQAMEMQDKDATSEQEGSGKGGVAPVAFMIIVGDAIHNFADGLAIGAAFTKSNAEGIATSIAVFCHELPHEMGDFAVLIQSGMRFRTALAWNFVSSLTSFIGLYVGLSVATDELVRRWIFAVAGGLFIYIALVDLLPSLIHARSRLSKGVTFLLHNLGILTGFAVMILLVIFEEKIKI